MNKKDAKTYAVCILIAFLTGIISMLFVGSPMKIYAALHKPPFAPPALVFPLVWTILYFLMGVSSAKIVLNNARSCEKAPAYLWYILQLIFNFVWPILFFRLGAYKISFIWIVLLWYAIFRMIVSFIKVDKNAAWLQIPYLLWVTFSTFLNLVIAALN